MLMLHSCIVAEVSSKTLRLPAPPAPPALVVLVHTLELVQPFEAYDVS